MSKNICSATLMLGLILSHNLFAFGLSDIKNAGKAVGGAIGGAGKSAGGAIGGAGKSVGGAIGGAGKSVGGAIGGAGKVVAITVVDGVKKAPGAVIGGAHKRAKIIWHDPIGSAINPIKIVDESIPSPMSIVEYTAKNPTEIIKAIKNPTAAVVGMPLAMVISDSRNSALKNGTRPMPEHLKQHFRQYFSQSLLDSVRYASGRSLFNGVAQAVTLNTTAAAVTLINVIVFRDAPGTTEAHDLELWAHELYHVSQYRKMGLLEFSATLTLTGAWGTGSNIEKPAYRFSREYAHAQNGRSLTPSPRVVRTTVRLPQTQIASQTRICYGMVQNKVAWKKGGSTKWNPVNVRKLCNGTTNAFRTVGCFKQNINSHNSWKRAIGACRR